LKAVCTVKPILFEDNLLLSLSKNWIDLFGNIPEFSVSLDNQGRLQLRTKNTIKKSSRYIDR